MPADEAAVSTDRHTNSADLQLQQVLACLRACLLACFFNLVVRDGACVSQPRGM